MDAKGYEFVIVSHAKGHANETHIALGLATRKKAEANKQADIRVVKAAQEHAIREIIMENYKIKEQQTKVIQRMLIKIHKERRNQYLLKKLKLYNKKQRSKMKNTIHGLKKIKKSERK